MTRRKSGKSLTVFDCAVLILRRAIFLGILCYCSITQAQVSELTVTTDTYGNWQVVCEIARGGEKSCVMSQQYHAARSGKRLLQANIARVAGGTLMTLILPLGIDLPAGVVLQIDEFEPHTFAIQFCIEEGCFINEILDPGLLELLRKKESAKLTIKLSSGETVHPPFSIRGFLDAYHWLLP